MSSPYAARFAWLLGLGLLSASRPALASNKAAQAEALFNEPARLMAKGKNRQACPKLKASLQLDPAGGTALRLAVCWERVGKTASAWAQYKQALSMAERARRQNRIQVCKAAIRRLEPKLAYVVLHLPASLRRTPNLMLKGNGEVLPPATWTTPLPVDPGPFKLELRAPGKQPHLRTLPAHKGKNHVHLPAGLQPAKKGQPGALPPGKATTVADDNPWPYIGWGAVGAGVLGVGAGVFFGLRASSKQSDADAICPTSQCSSQSAVDASQAAHDSATVTNAAMGAGLAFGIGGALILLLDPGGSSEGQGPQTGFSVGPNGGAIWGRF